MELGKETVKQEARKLLLDALQFVGISRQNRIPNNRRVFTLRTNYGKI
jgi:hypothetical protein